MIAAFRDFDVRRVLGCGDDARCQMVVEKRGRLRRQHAKIAFYRFHDAFHFAGAHDGIHFRHLLQNLRAKPFHQASCHNQFLRRAEFLVLRHFQDGVHGLFLRRFDKAARIHDQHLGFIGARRQFIALTRKNTHHHLAVYEVLRASQADESDLGHMQ